MTRTLLIGLDGMSFTLLKPLMEEGVMPFHKKFVETGAAGELLSTPCPVTPPAWTSIMTGRSPGHHGIYDFIAVDDNYSDRIAFRLTNARDVLCETIWSVAGRQGKKVGALNFPQTFQSQPFNGYLVPGFVTSRYLRTSTHPREFWDRIKDLPGFNVKDVAWDLDEGRKALGGGLTDENYGEWIGYLTRKEVGWSAIAKELLANSDCDLVAVVFEGMDRLQHQTWDILDPAFMPADPAPRQIETRGYCLDYYRKVDDLVRELVELAGEDSRVFIVSDHGFGSTTEIFYANVLLEKMGYLRWKDGVKTDSKGMLTAHNMREHFETIDWSQTVAYARTTSANGIYIRISREPGQPGIPPERYDSLRAELQEALRSYKGPSDGEPVVTKVLTREEAFPGKAMGQAPDLTITLRDGGFLSILKSDVVLKNRPKVSGTHRPEGIFLACGRNIKGGVSLLQRSILDVAPTLLYSLGLPVPSDFEGEVVTELFDPRYLSDNPVVRGGHTFSDDDEKAQTGEYSLGKDDEAQILERLKQLGYFG